MSKRVKTNINLDHKRQQFTTATPGKNDSEFASVTDTQAVRMDKLQPGGESKSKYPRN
ncbi:hypothetical protein DFP93_10986 [Aneurinibacillus soli]|uniref:Uncharacterized protein n=1 Tax=Aneurinibacillus soli TaxID=1500254 RepID=A0A0U5AVM1_9BACL|nr:hypothetical protein [Aneurinibacillus soli]PYE61385.1 hypothetical protein DFP93_10986 [Aneurinibacillus soli]BAU27786.1 hypothetical protein CB4_01960 [Aneurinibacillus soli]